jgi:hypothetical protein
MIHRVRVVAVAFASAAWLGAPVPAPAATYKCLLGGRVTYQDQPCAAEVAERGAEARIGLSGTPAPTLRAASGTEATHRDKLIETDLVPIARQAFDALRAGDLGVYLGLLCPRSRTTYGHPAMRAGLTADGERIARRGTELGRMTAATGVAVSFATVEGAPPDVAKAPDTGSFTAHFDHDGGRPCVLNVSHSRRR